MTRPKSPDSRRARQQRSRDRREGRRLVSDFAPLPIKTCRCEHPTIARDEDGNLYCFTCAKRIA